MYELYISDLITSIEVSAVMIFSYINGKKHERKIQPVYIFGLREVKACELFGIP
jgi:hypothetical protein